MGVLRVGYTRLQCLTGAVYLMNWPVFKLRPPWESFRNSWGRLQSKNFPWLDLGPVVIERDAETHSTYKILKAFVFVWGFSQETCFQTGNCAATIFCFLFRDTFRSFEADFFVLWRRWGGSVWWTTRPQPVSESNDAIGSRCRWPHTLISSRWLNRKERLGATMPDALPSAAAKRRRESLYMYYINNVPDRISEFAVLVSGPFILQGYQIFVQILKLL